MPHTCLAKVTHSWVARVPHEWVTLASHEWVPSGEEIHAHSVCKSYGVGFYREPTP